ncbi:MAG: hypothetical protein ACFCUR_15725 [Rhodomicrobiaceae bacterium]
MAVFWLPGRRTSKNDRKNHETAGKTVAHRRSVSKKRSPQGKKARPPIVRPAARADVLPLETTIALICKKLNPFATLRASSLSGQGGYLEMTLILSVQLLPSLAPPGRKPLHRPYKIQLF